ncbi:ABC transporter ATP-binding protein [Lacrimispora sphenoides]|uniref:ATP-binding cassette, subfamily B n=1 Tax=Lacrimispora sphenoides JCM 1415 TaxID=1297793 RepID=A0ABY1CFL2_9FIRM|nr:ABC transporter ATP-binding protein [Lacrimispora sphenoides]SET99167.1 ATP-binding cassette, subfamily B [[Clostridium] sphenoides JCM 1415]SUY53038.1 ABC transporter ATP-binding protein/permease [Lacrimispora sphenoides]
MSNNKMNHKNAKQPLRLFWDLLMLQKGKVFLTIFACIFGSMLYTAIPWFMGIAIDNMVAILKEFALPNINKDMVIAAIGTPVLIIIAASALSFLFSYIAERFMADVSEETSLYLRKEISKKLTNLPLRFYDRTKIGSLLSICSTDIDKISEILVIGFNQFMLAFFDLIFGIAIMLWISPKLTGIVLVVVAFSMFTTLFISRKSQAAFRKNLATLGNFNATVEELYSGSLLIKAFNTQDASIEKMKEVNEKQYHAHLKAQFMNYVIYPAVRFINQLAFILSAILGAILVIRGMITLGVVQAYLQYVSQVSEPMTQFAFVTNSFQAALASISRVYEILDAEEEIPDSANSIEIKKPKGEIAFQGVSFGYEPNNLLMKKVNFIAKANQTIAIVGPTGAGKTTLVNLLMRFYEIDNGKILFDGKDTSQMTRQHLRSLFGMVLQDTWLFKGTVADNIAYGRKDATREEIVAAAKLAQCDSFIRTLPDGYDTVISSEQSVLSQGQQQLLTIARTALANPHVLILDEATSSIDTITEIRIQTALAKLMQNRTSFMIAHRLSTIRNANLILVMKDGDIIETGSHDELIARDSFYARLYNS